MHTYDEQILSDLHKDAFGYRPSADFWVNWKELSDIGKQREWDYMVSVLKRTMEREQEEELTALADFEADLAKIMEIGCCDEKTALAWMTPIEFEENENLNSQDIEHWVWQCGILFTNRGREIVETLKQIYGVK